MGGLVCYESNEQHTLEDAGPSYEETLKARAQSRRELYEKTIKLVGEFEHLANSVDSLAQLNNGDILVSAAQIKKTCETNMSADGHCHHEHPHQQQPISKLEVAGVRQ